MLRLYQAVGAVDFGAVWTGCNTVQRIKNAPAGADTPARANQADYAAIGLDGTNVSQNILSVKPRKEEI